MRREQTFGNAAFVRKARRHPVEVPRECQEAQAQLEELVWEAWRGREQVASRALTRVLILREGGSNNNSSNSSSNLLNIQQLLHT